MAIKIRTQLNDFISAVSLQSNKVNTYAASLNRDGTVAITINGAVLFAKVFWSGPGGGAVSDANPTADRVTVFSADNSGLGTVDVQQFLNTLV